MLVGDVGGTNVRFALALRRGGGMRIERFEVYPGKEFQTFADALHRYLDQTGVRATAACFAVAGPVKDGVGQLTNRDWTVSSGELSREFGIRDVMVVNDFLAMARSVPELEDDAFEVLFEGVAVPEAPILVAGPGTGFGVSTILPTESGWRVVSGEGGHIAYAPRTELERDLCRILARDHGYVSNELVASGSGLPAVHAAFCEIYGVPLKDIPPAEMRARGCRGYDVSRADRTARHGGDGCGGGYCIDQRRAWRRCDCGRRKRAHSRLSQNA